MVELIRQPREVVADVAAHRDLNLLALAALRPGLRPRSAPTFQAPPEQQSGRMMVVLIMMIMKMVVVIMMFMMMVVDRVDFISFPLMDN